MGLGRAANAVLAAAPNFRLPGDTSGCARFYATDIITEPFVQRDGHLRGSDGTGSRLAATKTERVHDLHRTRAKTSAEERGQPPTPLHTYVP